MLVSAVPKLSGLASAVMICFEMIASSLAVYGMSFFIVGSFFPMSAFLVLMSFLALWPLLVRRVTRL